MVKVTIKPFLNDDQKAAKALIVSGLKDHWGIIDERKNPDLEDILNNYSKGVFLVAWANQRMVGTGGYLPLSETVVKIVRMSVAKEMRRQGVGSQILTELCLYARSVGYHKVILETTRTWSEVIAFYVARGFEISHYDGDDAYFEKSLR